MVFSLFLWMLHQSCGAPNNSAGLTASLREKPEHEGQTQGTSGKGAGTPGIGV